MINIKNIIFGIAILILTMFVSIYGINTFYEQPEYDDFCTNVRYPQPAFDKTAPNEIICPAVCVEAYEIKNGQCVFNECGSGCGPDGVNSFDTLEQCGIVLDGKNCWELYDNALEKHSRNVFIIAVPLGILILAIGAYFFALEAVGVGLMAGGAGTLIYGSQAYWRFADNWIKFAISLVGLVALIAFAYWFNKEKKFWKRFFKGKK
ncbi:MAG TPA: hypothetical protein VJ208_04295 [Candidatus Nanoarchaeia archaeon]|nr:hypothetical protein [Candidatus Nanoarchaeia archaeon]